MPRGLNTCLLFFPPNKDVSALEISASVLTFLESFLQTSAVILPLSSSDHKGEAASSLFVNFQASEKSQGPFS